MDGRLHGNQQCVVVNFSSHLIIIFPLFWGMVMYANEYKY